VTQLESVALRFAYLFQPFISIEDWASVFAENDNHLRELPHPDQNRINLIRNALTAALDFDYSELTASEAQRKCMSTVFVCLWRLSDRRCTHFLGHVSDVRSQARRKVERFLIKIFPDLELDDGNKVDPAGNNVKDLQYRYSFLYEDQNSKCNNNN
jgi:hypothetical protein